MYNVYTTINTIKSEAVEILREECASARQKDRYSLNILLLIAYELECSKTCNFK